MSLVTDLEEVVDAARIDADVMREIVQGPASGPTSLVTTENGDVKTFARRSAEFVPPENAVGLITIDTTKIIGTSEAADFAEPGDFTEWLADYRIAKGVTVTVEIEDGTYACDKTIGGHIDGARVTWTNNGLNGSALVGSDFASLDAIWVISPTTGITEASRDDARDAAEVIVRAKYKVILEFDDQDAMLLMGEHSGDWSDCPCLFINTGGVTNNPVGISTGAGVTSSGIGAGGAGIVDASCWFGFYTCVYADYGGVINWPGGLALFGEAECSRTNFEGSFTGNDIIIIGGLDFGHRCNHGGSCYSNGAYLRGNKVAAEATQTNSGYRFHQGDIQFNYIGAQVSWGGSCKIFQASVKNNARMQINVQNGGAVDAGSLDGASTELFEGAPPLYGIFAELGGTIELENGEMTGHGTADIFITGSVTVDTTGATYDTALTSGSVSLAPTTTGILMAPPPDRPTAGTVEMSGTTLTLPFPCPKAVSVVQPSGSAGSAITIDTIDITNLPAGGAIFLIAVNAGSGETITVNDSGSTPALAALSRYLGDVRDVLKLERPRTADQLLEVSYKRINANATSDRKAVRILASGSSDTFTEDDDVLVINKSPAGATAVAMATAVNYKGREVIIKDGKGDANSNNITITPGGSKNIDGSGTYVINTNYGRVRIIYNGVQWNVIGA